MAPWSFTDLLHSDVMTWAVNQSRRDGEGIPAAVYLDRLAVRMGLTRRQLMRILEGEQLPNLGTVRALFRTIGSTAAIEVLAEDCGVRICTEKVCRAAGGEGTAAPHPTALRVVGR